MSSQICLTYFNYPGRAEAIRLVFAIGYIIFEDHRISNTEFNVLKRSLPFGQLPVLRVDKGPYISQSMAILRYAGRLSKLYPDDPLEALKVDEILDSFSDLERAITQSEMELSEFKKSQMKKKIVVETFPKLAKNLEKKLEESNTGFFVQNITIADVLIAERFRYICSDKMQCFSRSMIEPYKLLQILEAKIFDMPQVKKYFREIEGGN